MLSARCTQPIVLPVPGLMSALGGHSHLVKYISQNDSSKGAHVGRDTPECVFYMTN